MFVSETELNTLCGNGSRGGKENDLNFSNLSCKSRKQVALFSLCFLAITIELLYPLQVVDPGCPTYKVILTSFLNTVIARELLLTTSILSFFMRYCYRQFHFDAGDADAWG